MNQPPTVHQYRTVGLFEHALHLYRIITRHGLHWGPTPPNFTGCTVQLQVAHQYLGGCAQDGDGRRLTLTALDAPAQVALIGNPPHATLDHALQAIPPYAHAPLRQLFDVLYAAGQSDCDLTVLNARTVHITPGGRIWVADGSVRVHLCDPGC